MLWSEYWSIAYENSTTVPASSKWPGWIPQIEVKFSLLKGSLKKTPKMGHNQENLSAGTLACQIQSFVSAVYGYRNLATRGFQTAGCFGGNSRRSLELIQLSNRNGNQIASKTSSSSASHSKQPLLWKKNSGGYPVTFLRMTFRFCSLQPAKTTPLHQFSAWMGCWQVHHCLGCSKLCHP